MPIPEDKLRKPETLHRWFAISSLLMTASIFWMIWIDYDRPWRAFQDDYATGKAVLAHLDYLDATRQERIQEIDEARQGLADARDLAAQTTGVQRAKLVADLSEADLRFRKFDGEWSRKSQVHDVSRDTYEKIVGEHGPDAAETIHAREELQVEEAEVERVLKIKEGWGDKKERFEAELKLLDASVSTAAKRLTELEDVAADALKEDMSYRGVLYNDGLLGGLAIVSTIINLPLLDFTAPNATPARHQVKQLVLPDVRQRLNYLESYTTDRCTTCHIAIDDPEFSKDRLAKRLERALSAINEAMQRLAHEPFPIPVPPVAAATGQPLPAGHVTDHWAELTDEQQDAYFERLLGMVNSYLELSGRKTIDLGQPLLAHPDLGLFLSVDSPHPMARMGCTVCHEGNPQETDFVQAAHSPATHEIREAWEKEYYIRLMGVPNVTFETIEHYWDRPMLLPQYTEAGCAKCHSEISDIQQYDGERKGSRINLGRHLFATVGCINCHKEDSLEGAPRVGPDLRQLAVKLTPGFVQKWAYYPQKFRPSTRMPHFFEQENSGPQSANSFDTEPVRRTETEVAAITKYLFAVSGEWTPIEKPADVKGDVERGRQLFTSMGCLGCHANITEYGEAWITADLAHREGIDEETATHRYKGMTYEQRMRYAMDHFGNERETFLQPDLARFDPDASYNTPTLTSFGPEVSGLGSKVNEAWLYSWLIEPTHYSPDTKMPNMRLTPAEAADLTAYLLTLKNDDFEQGEFELDEARQRKADELVFILLSAQRSAGRSRAIMKDEGGELSDMLISLLKSSREINEEQATQLIDPMSLLDKKLMYLGNKMISHYGCYACHEIPGFETTTPPGTDMSAWAEKPVGQLDFAFYDHAFEHLREEKPDVFGYLYPLDATELNARSPMDDRAREQVSGTHAAFAKHKMLNPRIWDREKIKRPYDKLKMPNFYFTEEEAEALTAFLLSRIPPRVNDVLKIDYEGTALGPIARGRNLTRELNCVGCHEIEDNAPTIQQYYRRTVGGELTFDSLNAPPLLWGEGAKVQHNWLHGFFQNVEPLRPWLQARMPTFNLTGEEATTLVEYFAALSRKDAQVLHAARAPIREYIDEQKDRVTDEDAKASAGDDWYQQERVERRTDVLRRWVVDRKLTRARSLDPLRTPADRVRQAHAGVLERVDFMADLYDVAYPFVEPPKPLSSPEVFDRGRSLFNDMGCLQCHVLGNMLPGPAKNTDDFVQMYRLDGVRGEGDKAIALINETPYAVGSVIDGHTLISAANVYSDTGDVDTSAIFEGPSAAGETERIRLQPPSAPNLSLTYQRLRRAWVYAWMLQPMWIQPGTRMPQNFPDGVSPFEGDPNYPGNGLDHINLLVDFLYHAGATGARSPLTKLMAGDEDEEFDEDFDEDFDDGD